MAKRAKAFAKRKGQRFEWQCRDILLDRAGWGCKTVPLSGAHADHGGDLKALTPSNVEFLIQCKVYANATGYGRMLAALSVWGRGFEIPGEWVVAPLPVMLGYLEGGPMPFRLPVKEMACGSANAAVDRAGEQLLIVKQNRTKIILALARPDLLLTARQCPSVGLFPVPNELATA